MTEIMEFLSKIDAALVFMIVSAVVSLYGLILFGYEWWRIKDASFAFKSITFLFLGEFINNSIGSYGRWILIFRQPSEFIGFLQDNWIWCSKYVLTTIALSVICWYMTIKMLTSVKNEKKYRENDRRKAVR